MGRRYDAYTPVFNGISSWQLYHGPGFWSPVAFPVDNWFTIRVAFAGRRAEVFVGDLEAPAQVAALRRPVEPGRVGIFVGGPAGPRRPRRLLRRRRLPRGAAPARRAGRGSDPGLI